MQSLLKRMAPFFIFGIMLVLFVAGFIIVSYLLIFGALVGLVLFIIAWVKETFFPSKKIIKPQSDAEQNRIIDHEK